MKCAFCQKIGNYLSISLDEKEIIPKEFDNFETVLVSKYKFQQVNFPVTYIRCPKCHTYYQKTRTIDNEIMHGSDDIEFKEMTEERVNELIQYQKNEMKRFSEEIDSRLGEKQADLTPAEKAIIDIFKNELKEEITVYDIAAQFEKGFHPPCDNSIIYPINKAQWEAFEKQIMPAINALIEKRILKQYNVCNIEHYKIC